MVTIIEVAVEATVVDDGMVASPLEGTVEVRVVVETAVIGGPINVIWDAFEPHSTTVTYPIELLKSQKRKSLLLERQ